MGSKTIITGNLGKDPELRYVAVKSGTDTSDRAVCHFSVYQSHERKNTETGNYEDTGGFWVEVTVWGRDAETCTKLLKKGYAVKAAGTLYMTQWQDNDNATRISHRLEADRDGVTIMPYNLESVTVRPYTGSSAAPNNAPTEQEAS